MKLYRPVVALAAALGCLTSHAAFVKGETGLTAPEQTITFETLAVPPNQPVTNQLSAFGMTFSNTFANPDPGDYPNLSGQRIGNFQANISFAPDFAIDFAFDLSQVSFALVAARGSATFQAWLDGVLVESATSATSATNASNFYGFQGIVFDQLRVRADTFDNAFLMDNLQTVAAIPEPETWALMLAGLGLLVRSTRRFRTRASP